MIRRPVIILVAGCCIMACSNPKPAVHDILISDMDSTVKPGDDFFAYANGGWMKKNPIPGDETAWGIGELVQKELYVKLQKINEDAEKKRRNNRTRPADR